jgi:hypothetical protein
MQPNNFSILEEKAFEMKAYRGKVISVTSETKTGGHGSHGKVVIGSITFTTIHVALDNGLQKSIEISKSGIHCIEGNEVFFVATDANELVFLKNFASESSATATVFANNSGGEGKGSMTWIIGLIAIFAAFAVNTILGVIVIIGCLYLAFKNVKSGMSQMDIYNKQFRDLLVANSIDIATCKSNLNPVPAS